MLVQRRAEGLRLVRQHDHALAAGRMARAWRGVGDAERLNPELILAVALHDAPWQKADRRPRLDPRTGSPYDFATYPRGEKYAFLARGLDRLAELHPYLAILVSLHHESFLPEKALPEWKEKEARRRERLVRRGGSVAGDPERDLPLLQLFDNLSLFLCLTPPGADSGSVPGWLLRDRLYTAPAGGPVLERGWRGPDTLALRPFPFTGEVELQVPYRDQPPGPYQVQEELNRAWREGEEEVWRPRLVPF